MEWDTIVAVLIIAGLVLTIWARVSHQTITELLRDIIDLLKQRKEDAEEYTSDILVPYG